MIEEVMTALSKVKIIFAIIILMLLIPRAVIVDLQAVPTATPFSPILIQGNPNIGRVQPFAMSAVAVRTGIRAWQDAGWTGSGRKVGVLDRGFGGIRNFENTFRLTVTVALGDDKIAYDGNPIIHGTQVLETIHAVAPGAELYACQYQDLDSFTICIDWMISSKVNIINHSAGVPALPLDGTSRWAKQVDRTAQANILWVNSAGNFAQGYYTDFFTDAGDATMKTNIPNSLHEFRGSYGILESLGVSKLPNGGNGVVMLSWDSHNGVPANEIDLDLQIIDAHSGEVITYSQNQQTGFPGDQPLEYVNFDMSRDFAVQVRSSNPNVAGVRFVLFVEFANLPGGEGQRSIIAPGDSVNAITVGALQGTTLAPYSSRGPIETGAIKPDLAAPGEVELANGTQFVGTSAASPVVAGSAALIWEANPAYTARDVRTFLLNGTQDDDEIAGNDNNYGNGRLYLPLPVGTAVAIVQTNTPSPTETQTNSPTITATTTSEATRVTPQITASATQSNKESNHAIVTVNVSSANLRNGPGTHYNIASAAASGEQFPVIARYEDWYLVEQGNGNQAWIWSGIVDLTPSNIQIALAATIPPTPSLANVSSPNRGTSNLFNITRITVSSQSSYPELATGVMLVSSNSIFISTTTKYYYVNVYSNVKVSEFKDCGGIIYAEINGVSLQSIWTFRQGDVTIYVIPSDQSGNGRIISLQLCAENKSTGEKTYETFPINVSVLFYNN